MNLKAFVIAITSGILGSMIVAVVFYINEYYSEKRKIIYEIIRESNKFQEIYAQIPYLEKNGNYYDIERHFYYEVLENRETQKIINVMKDTLEMVARDYSPQIKLEVEEKIENLKKQQKEEYKDILKKVLEENPDFRKSTFGKNVIPVDQALEDIAIKYDLYIERMMAVYASIQEVKFEKLELLVKEYSGFFYYSLKAKKQIIEQLKRCDKEMINIYPFTKDERISTKIICERILNIHENFYRKLETILSIAGGLQDESRKKEGLTYFLYWQDELFGDDIKKIPMIDNDGSIIKEYELEYAYSRLSMCIDNLHKILFREVCGVFELSSQENYAKTLERVEYGYLNNTISFTNEDMGNIFRKKRDIRN